MSETGNNNFPEKIPNFVIFKTADGKVNIDVYFHNETLWLSQKFIAELFQKDRSVISKHLKNIFESGELEEKVVCSKFAHTTQHGAMDDERLKALQHFGRDYFDELLERIREIRLSERCFYQKIGPNAVLS